MVLDFLCRLIHKGVMQKQTKDVGGLARRYVVSPFSVLDGRSGPWQDRKRQWLACGIEGEVQATGRGAGLAFNLLPRAHRRGRPNQSRKRCAGCSGRLPRPAHIVQHAQASPRTVLPARAGEGVDIMKKTDLKPGMLVAVKEGYSIKKAGGDK